LDKYLYNNPSRKNIYKPAIAIIYAIAPVL
jgi:hypothetical protein